MRGCLVSLLLFTLSVHAAMTLEDVSPQFATKTQIIWKAPTNALPRNVRFYKAVSPRIFSDSTISNAIMLAPLQEKGFKWSARKELCIDYDTCPCGHVCTFQISPKRATLAYCSPTRRNGSAAGIPDNDTLTKRAWGFAFLLGLDQTQLSIVGIRTNSCEYDDKGQVAEKACGHSIILSMLIDGIDFCGPELVQGFSLELGSGAGVRAFCLTWPELAPMQNSPVALPDQIIACIRARKTPLVPCRDDTNYFGRLKSLATADNVTITSIRPHYGEGVYGELPKEGDGLPNIFTPIAELEGTAELEKEIISFRLYSPIAASEVTRLLVGEKKPLKANREWK